MTATLNDLVTKYDRPVPRYTSYPTAPHFSDAIGEPDYRAWLGALDASLPLSLYTHVPYCASMCWFCGCHTKIVKRYTPVADYVGQVLEEMKTVAALMPQRMAVSHMHWGGGSPTMLMPDDWQSMMAQIAELFEVEPGCECAVELDPRTTTAAYISALANAGINRVSIGVQDFDEKVQRAINRIQPFDVTARVVEWLRQAGINAINMDLMYGLPHQSVATVVSQVELAVSLKPQRIALFGYAHVPWMKSHQKLIDENVLPDGQERWAQFEAARAHLGTLGYVAIGLDHFALASDPLARGNVQRNFQGYTTDDASALIGFGPSAISALPQGYVQNHLPLHHYASAVAAGGLPIARGLALSSDDRARRDIINALMCRLDVDLGPQAGRYDKALKALEPMVEDGLVIIDGGHISVTEAGRPYTRLVASAFDAYLNSDKGRHSRAL